MTDFARQMEWRVSVNLGVCFVLCMHFQQVSHYRQASPANSIVQDIEIILEIYIRKENISR